MILIALLLTFIILISIPILGFKIIKAFIKKDRPRLYKLFGLLLILILVPGFFWQILPGSDFFWGPIEKVHEKNYNEELTGFEFHDGELLYEYVTERAFNGDGYSIWIYEIDEETARYFKNPNPDFFTKYPNPEFRSDWETEYWKKTPFDTNEQKFLDFAHSSLDEMDFELEDLLNESGNYYAYKYYIQNFSEGRSYVANIDFYIICPDRKLIVKINHNT